jgi:hypothetical protein
VETRIRGVGRNAYAEPDTDAREGRDKGIVAGECDCWNAPSMARHEGQSSAFCTAERRASVGAPAASVARKWTARKTNHILGVCKSKRNGTGAVFIGPLVRREGMVHVRRVGSKILHRASEIGNDVRCQRKRRSYETFVVFLDINMPRAETET